MADDKEPSSGNTDKPLIVTKPKIVNESRTFSIGDMKNRIEKANKDIPIKVDKPKPPKKKD